MHAILRFQVAVGKLALDLHGHRLDTGLIAVLIIADGAFITMGFSPTHVHAHQHRCPILAFRTSGTGIDFQHRVHRVFLLPQHIAQLKVFKGIHRTTVQSVHLFFGNHLFLVEIKSKFQLIAQRLDLLITVNPLLQALYFFHLFFRSLGIVPKPRCLCAELLFLHLDFLVFNIQIAVKRLSTRFYIFQLLNGYHKLKTLVQR